MAPIIPSYGRLFLVETWLLGGVFAPLIPMNIHHGWFRWRRLDLQIWNPEVATSSGGCHINPPRHDFNSISAPEKIGHHSTPLLRKRVDRLPMLDSRSVLSIHWGFGNSSWNKGHVPSQLHHEDTSQIVLPTRELTYPPKMAFWTWFSQLPQVGYVNFLEGRSIISI